MVAGTVGLCIASGPCAGKKPKAVIRKILDDAAAYNRRHPDYGYVSDFLQTTTRPVLRLTHAAQGSTSPVALARRDAAGGYSAGDVAGERGVGPTGGARSR